MNRFLLAACLLGGVSAEDDDFVECKFETCPENIALFPYDKDTADKCVGDQCAEAIAFSKGIFKGPGNKTIDEIGEHACGLMHKWKNISQPCFKSCHDQSQIQGHFDISKFKQQDCMDYQRDTIDPPPPYEYDYGEDEETEGQDEEAEDQELNMDAKVSRVSGYNTTFIAGVVCIVVGAVAILAAVFMVSTKKNTEEPALTPGVGNII